MLRTDHYLRFERVTAVSPTPRGLVADVHGEQLHVEVVATDVVRLTMSRGGRIDDEPTFAVCVDPFADPVEHRVERDDDRVRLVTSDLVVSVWLDPFRVDVHRADGTVVLETAADADGRYWAYATLNDAFTLPAALPARGRLLRAGGEGRSAQPPGARLHPLEHRRAQPGRRRRSSRRAGRRTTRAATGPASSSTRTT